MSEKTDHGMVEIILGEYLQKRDISMNYVAKHAEMNRSRVSAYCRNQVQRPDLDVLARICHALDCDLPDILRYKKPR